MHIERPFADLRLAKNLGLDLASGNNGFLFCAQRPKDFVLGERQ